METGRYAAEGFKITTMSNKEIDREFKDASEFDRSRERNERIGFLPCLIRDYFPQSPGEDLLFVARRLDQKPIVDLAPKTEVITKGPSQSSDMFGKYDFGLVKVFVLEEWMKDNGRACVVDFYQPAYPPIVDRRSIIFDPQSFNQSSNSLDRWYHKNRREIEDYERACFKAIQYYIPRFLVFPKILVVKGENNDSGNFHSS